MKAQRRIGTSCEHPGHERICLQPGSHRPVIPADKVRLGASSMSREMPGLGRLAQGTKMGRLTATLWFQQRMQRHWLGCFPRLSLWGPPNPHQVPLWLHCHPRVECHDKAPGQRGSGWPDNNILVWLGAGLVGSHPCLRCHTEWLSFPGSGKAPFCQLCRIHIAQELSKDNVPGTARAPCRGRARADHRKAGRLWAECMGIHTSSDSSWCLHSLASSPEYNSFHGLSTGAS